MSIKTFSFLKKFNPFKVTKTEKPRKAGLLLYNKDAEN
jgi:hypothetical protein